MEIDCQELFHESLIFSKYLRKILSEALAAIQKNKKNMNKEQKAKQIEVNKLCEIAYRDFKESLFLDEFYWGKNFSLMSSEWFQLGSCKAYTCNKGNYIILKSYNTIVAFIDVHERVLYDVLRVVYGYTATSAKHISKFKNMYRDCAVYTWREI